VRRRARPIGIALVAVAAQAAGAAPPEPTTLLVPPGPEFASRSEALTFLFVVWFFAPFGLALGAAALGFLGAVVRGFLLTVTGALRLPDWTATTGAVAALAGAAYLGRGLWWPRSLWLLDLLTLAWRAALA
jgi:hypothetical protein